VDGTVRLDARASTQDLSRAASMGRRLARKLIANGAREILDEIRNEQAK